MNQFKKVIGFFLLLNAFLSAGLFGQIKTKEEIREYFNDVLLIIHFNHPHYDNIGFLKDIYGPYFPNIVVYGEKEAPGVNAVSSTIGWYVQKVMSDAIVRYPGYKGYICCQDDCFMNFWNYVDLDKERLWLHQFWTASLATPNHWWPWWGTECGQKAAVVANRKLKKLQGKGKNYYKTLNKNCGENNFAFTWADFFYVPASYSQDFLVLSKQFLNPNIFLEISIPTIFLSLEDFENIEKLRPNWGGTGITLDLATYNPDDHWVHPIKFSKESNRDFCRKAIEDAIGE